MAHCVNWLRCRMVRRRNLSPGVIIMTNHEYERASVQAAIGLMKLTAVDEQIEQVESTRVFLLHSRREIVSQYDLNKPVAVVDTITQQVESLAPGAPKINI